MLTRASRLISNGRGQFRNMLARMIVDDGASLGGRERSTALRGKGRCLQVQSRSEDRDLLARSKAYSRDVATVLTNINTYVYVYVIYHCGCTALPTRRLDRLIFVVRKTRNPLQLWDAPCSFQRVIHFSCGVEDSPRFLSSRQKRLYISSSCRHRCGTELIVLDLELPPRISSVLQLLHHPLSTHEYF